MPEGSGEISLNIAETRTPVPTFEQKLDALTQDNEQGPAPITDPKLKKLIGALKMSQNQTPQGIQRLIDQGNQWYYETEDSGFENQWTILGTVIAGKLQETGSQTTGGEGQGTLERIAVAVERSVTLSQSQAKANEVEVSKLKGDKEKQLAYFRPLVEQIEDGHVDTRDWANSLTVKNIEAAYRIMDPEVKEEISVRLALHDASRLVYEANGHITAPKSDAGALTIGKAANEARSRDHELTRHVMEYLLLDKIPGLKVSVAWDCLQKVNIYDRRDSEKKAKIPTYDDYIAIANRLVFANNLKKAGINLGEHDFSTIWDFLVANKFDLIEDKKLKPEIENFLKRYNIAKEQVQGLFKTDDLSELRDTDVLLGKVKPTYYTDSNTARKEAVESVILGEIMAAGGEGFTLEAARRSLLLAEKLTIATLETSIFNKRALAGSDDLAEIIDFDKWRKNRKMAGGRDYGPEITEGEISSLGGSFFRTLKPELKIGNEMSDGIYFVDNKYPIWASQIAKGENGSVEGLIIEIKEASWVTYCTVTLGRYNTVKELLLDTKPKPGDIDIYYLREKVAAFNTVDPHKLPKSLKKEIEKNYEDDKAGADEEKRKRELSWPMGSQMLRYYWILGVVSEALMEPMVSGWDRAAIRALEKAVCVDRLSPDPSVGTFLPRKVWDSIAKQVGVEQKLAKLELYSGFRSGFGQGKSSGGKKR